MATLRKEDEILRDNIKLRLKELRETHGKTKAGVSQNVDIDRQNFQAWEKLDTNRGMSIYSINRVCNALGITLKEFFDSPIFK
ncbi:helix-turn-helix transcriptional regulator [Flavobacterium sp. MK4S-17]|uniref:helix-turn-helix transcriptional regulator n=1 Tax=Flavobacterium sp. MK4S-17 TaxID=2543737 RepID=UPI0013598C7B|nr:helix-turn-helix transcriptional regulator [Flavobacterium sp. MK4S-17]